MHRCSARWDRNVVGGRTGSLFRLGLIVWALLWLTASVSFAQSSRCSDTPDGLLRAEYPRFSLQGSAFAQLQYQFFFRSEEVSRSDFSVPRARVCGSGHVLSRSLRYRLMIGRSSQRELEVNDVFVEWEPVSALAIRLGRFKLPIVHEWMESAQSLATLDRALASRLLLPGRDYGLRVSGRLLAQHVEYLIGVFNGDGESAVKAADLSPALVARLSLHLTGSPYVGAVDFAGSWPQVSLAAGTLWNRWKQTVSGSTSPPQSVEDTLWNVSALFRWNHFDGAAEYIGQRRTDAHKTQRTHAGYLRLTYFVQRLHSSVSARGSLVSVRSDQTDNQLEAEGSWGVYLDRHRIKVISRYAVVQNLTQSTIEHQLGLQTQIAVD